MTRPAVTFGIVFLLALLLDLGHRLAMLGGVAIASVAFLVGEWIPERER